MPKMKQTEHEKIKKSLKFDIEWLYPDTLNEQLYLDLGLKIKKINFIEY